MSNNTKYGLSITFILIFAGMALSQDMNYFLTQNLKGVNSMALTHFEIKNDRPDSLVKTQRKEEYAFDPEGRIISYKAYEDGKIYLETEYTYDALGRTGSERTIKENKTTAYSFSYGTDSLTGDAITSKTENGHLVYRSKKHVVKNGFYFIDYSDANGVEIRQEYYGPDGKIQHKFFYGTDTKTEYRYDDQGNLVALKTIAPGGKSSATTRFSNHYANGRLASIENNGTSFEFAYDNSGRLVSFIDSAAAIKTEACYTLY